MSLHLKRSAEYYSRIWLIKWSGWEISASPHAALRQPSLSLSLSLSSLTIHYNCLFACCFAWIWPARPNHLLFARLLPLFSTWALSIDTSPFRLRCLLWNPRVCCLLQKPKHKQSWGLITLCHLEFVTLLWLHFEADSTTSSDHAKFSLNWDIDLIRWLLYTKLA